MSRKAVAVILVLTTFSVGVLILNVSSEARGALTGASYKDLINDRNFTHAVKSVIEACRVNVDLARVFCK